ncbi:folate receptor [Paragonimus westermani]|uniref:Folate receptor n=1 Tax=Paragonimus westermani TaxID=34504 RepID=A0A5J4NA33_9TREM|nr:folate receptor [Paragonimus westermani]
MALTLLIQAKLCFTDNRLNHIRTVDEYISTCPVRVEDNKTTPRAGPGDKIPISEKCAQFFLRDLCHYECSPHMGPWLVKTTRKIGVERAFGVPLCVDDCDAWWDACKTEQTCVRDWSVEFEWHSAKTTRLQTIVSTLTALMLSIRVPLVPEHKPSKNCTTPQGLFLYNFLTFESYLSPHIFDRTVGKVNDALNETLPCQDDAINFTAIR